MLDFNEVFCNIQRLVNYGFVEEAKSLYGSVFHDIEQQERDTCMDRNYYLNEYMTRSIPNPDIPEPMFLSPLGYKDFNVSDLMKIITKSEQKSTDDIWNFLEKQYLSKYYPIDSKNKKEDKNKSCYFESMIEE